MAGYQGAQLAGNSGAIDRLAAFPQRCMLNDWRSAYDQWSLSFEDALANENALGREVLASGETVAGASRFASGKG